MALSKSTITGRVPLPTDENLQFAELTFALSGLDTEGADVLPGGISTRIVLIDSDIPPGFELWQNTAGLRGTHYRVLARWTVKDRDGISDQYADLGVIQIGSDPSYPLADLLNSSVPQAVGTFWTVLSQAQYDAAIQAAIDAQAWAESPTAPGVPGTKSSKTWAAEAAASAADAQDILDEIETIAATANTYQFTATAGQSVYTGADVLGNVLQLANAAFVSIDGVSIGPSGYSVSVDHLTLTLTPALAALVLTSSDVVIGGIAYALESGNIQYPEITTPYTVQPNAHRWDLLSFLGAKAEVAKSEAIQDWSEVLEVALQSGEKVNIGARVWPIRQALYADKGVSVEDVPVDVEASSDARLTFYSIDFEGGYFDLRSANEASATNRWKPRWHGGIFDCSNLSTALVYGISVFDVFHATDLDFSGMSFLGWNNALSLGTVDTGITLHKCPNFSIRNLFGSGMTDNLLYLSGDNTSGPFNLYADGGLVDGITSWRCNNMVALKRWHRGAVIKNFRAIEGNNGILSSPTDGSTTNHGHSAQISNGYMLRMSGRPIQITGGVDTKISEVVIEDYGCTLADPSIPTAVSDDNNIAGIDLRATVDSAVTGCTIRQNEWAGSTQADADKLITGVRLGRYSTSGSVYSTGCVIKENKIIGAHRGILEDAGCSNNVFEDNQVVIPSSGTTAQSAILGTGTVNKPAEKMYTLTNDPTTIAAGAELVVTITAADVKKGDIVFAWLGNRQAGDTGVNALNMKALCANGQIDIVLTNNAASSADLGNTVFNALARPTI